MLVQVATGLLLSVSVKAQFNSVRPFWVVQHDALVSTRLDPVIKPGTVSGHVHQFIGGANMSPVIDFASMQSATCTTSNLDIDKSNYWMPQLYHKTASGLEAAKLHWSNTYYEVMRTGPEEPIYEFPPGFRMVGGQSSRSTYDPSDTAQEAVSYTCLNYARDPAPWVHDFPKERCPDGLRTNVYMPSCWDGKNNWLEGSKHVAYPTGGFNTHTACPASHPKRIVQILIEFIYQDAPTYQPNSRVWAVGDTTGYSAHADFANGWPEGFFTKIFAEGAACDAFFDLAKCPVLAPHFRPKQSCSFGGTIVDEPIGDQGGVPTLPGNNPLYASEGPNRNNGYREEKGLKKAAGGSVVGRDQTEKQIPATILRGDPQWPAGNEVIQLSGSVTTSPELDDKQKPEQEPAAPFAETPSPVTPSTAPVAGDNLAASPQANPMAEQPVTAVPEVESPPAEPVSTPETVEDPPAPVAPNPAPTVVIPQEPALSPAGPDSPEPTIPGGQELSADGSTAEPARGGRWGGGRGGWRDTAVIGNVLAVVPEKTCVKKRRR